MAIVGIHQPNFAPWLGYFYKIVKSDYFVLLDDVQYTKGSYQNRTRILTSQGPQWLTIPVLTKGKQFPLTNEVEICYKENWIKKHLKTLEVNYKKAKHFDQYYLFFEKIYNNRYHFLHELCEEIIVSLSKELQIRTSIRSSSTIDIDKSAKSTERLILLCKYFQGDTYLSGKGGANYQDERKYAEHQIALIYTDFAPFSYPQMWTDHFEAGLSIIDYLFNCGSDSLKERLE